MEFFRRLVSKKSSQESKPALGFRHKGIEPLGALYVQRDELSPSDALDRLESIHREYKIPNFPSSEHGDSDLWFYKIMEAVSHSPQLNKEDAQRMVKMFSWQEVDIQGVGGVNFSIIHAAERFPQPEIYEGLESHLKKVKSWKEIERTFTHRRADLNHESDRIEALLSKCKPIQ